MWARNARSLIINEETSQAGTTVHIVHTVQQILHRQLSVQVPLPHETENVVWWLVYYLLNIIINMCGATASCSCVKRFAPQWKR